jgi:hypothetical protein
MEPYLSVVVAARNESERELAGIRAFVDGWIRQAKRHDVSSEVIVVVRGLVEAVDIPENGDVCQVRLVDVPEDVRMNVARNAGIRVARGEFVLAANPGIRFSEELMRRFAARDLAAGRMYRMDVHTADSPAGADPAHPGIVDAREGTFPLTDDGLRRNRPDDISPIESGLNFGEGWFPPEKYPGSGETVRWMRDGAEIHARVPHGGGILLLEMEPGPGLGAAPRTLQVRDERGARVAEWNIDGRVSVALAVPGTEPAKLRSFRLHVPDAGRPVLDDDRILDLAVFHFDWVAPNRAVSEEPSLRSAIQQHKVTLQRLLGARRKTDGVLSALARGPVKAVRTARLLSRRGRDIFESGLDFRLGPGWFHLEDSGAERFRWMGADARFFLRMPQSPSRLALLIEPRHGDAPLTFVARWENENGKVLAHLPIAGLTYLEFAAPAAPGSVVGLHFAVAGSLEPTGMDPRRLGFRIFACGAGSRCAERPAALDHWPVLPLVSKSVARDWMAELDSVRSQLDEMGRPEHLHTNAASDFLLMSRADWLDLRGFPEIDLTEELADALLCYAAHHAGIREEVLTDPLRIYRVGGDRAPGSAPAIEREDLVWLILEMRSLRTPVIFNPDDWGGTLNQ